MARQLHVDTRAALLASSVFPAWVVRLDIQGDPLYAWTGLRDYSPVATGDASLDGVVYEGVGHIGQVGNIIDSVEGSQAVSLTLPGIDLADDALKQFVWDARVWQFRRAWMWIALMDETGSVIGRPIRFKTGRMDRVRAGSEGGEGSLVVDLESHQAYAAEALTSRYSEQIEIDSTDTSQRYVHDLANRQPSLGVAPTPFTVAPGTPETGGGGGGGGGGGYIGGGGVSGGGRCVAPGTMVLTPSGDEVAVETLVAGDEVFTQREEDLCWGAYVIEAVELAESEPRCLLELEDGRRLLATPNHRMFTEERGWAELETLDEGDHIIGLRPGVVRKVERVDDGPVVRLGVEGARTLQTEGLLSHNVKMDLQLY